MMRGWQVGGAGSSQSAKETIMKYVLIEYTLRDDVDPATV